MKIGSRKFYTAFARDCSKEREERFAVEQVLAQANDAADKISALVGVTRERIDQLADSLRKVND